MSTHTARSLRFARRAHLLLAPLLAGLAFTQYATDASAAPMIGKEDAPPAPPKPPAPSYSASPDGFHWSAESRVDRWVKAWRPQTWPEKSFPTVQSYDPDYVNPKAFNIDVQGCVDKSDWDRNMAGKDAVNTYTWTFNGKVQSGKRCVTKLAFPAQGIYPVTLEVKNASGKKLLSKSRDVRVKDILIVALGDSMSSGEGSPDARIFEGTPFRPAQWVDRQCHRSKSAPAALAAKQIEQMDPDVLAKLKVVNNTQPNAGKGGSKVVVKADGSFTYTPGPNVQGVETFLYTVSDGQLESTGRVTITVGPPVRALPQTIKVLPLGKK